MEEGKPAGGLYPMRLVTRLTGLSADTIRAWERRYSAIEPRRSAGNTRRFSAEDVRRLVLLREATSRGHAISSIARLNVGELERLIGDTEEVARVPSGATPLPSRPEEDRSPARSSAGFGSGSIDRGLQELRNDYIEAVARFDSRRAYEILMRAATFLDRRELIFGVVVPLVSDFGQRWANGELGVAQEQMVSAQLRSVLSSLLRFSPPGTQAKQVILSTPPGHRHEFGILVTALLAAARGLDPLYLGPDLPFEELSMAVRMSQAEVVVLGVARDMSPEELRELPLLLEQLSEAAEVWMAVPLRHAMTVGFEEVRAFHDFESIDAEFGRLSGSGSS